MSKEIHITIEKQRLIITRFVMIYCILCLLLRAMAHTLPSQLAQPVLTRAGYNIAHILYRASGIGEWLTQYPFTAQLFNVFLFGAAALLAVFPRKNYFAVLFSILLLLFIITTNIYVNFNQHYLFLLWLATLPFCMRSDRSFALLWEGLRFYACWVYGSTFILKLINGAMWQWDYGLQTMKEQVAEYVFLNPGSTLTMAYSWLIQHGTLVNIGQKFVFLAEGMFLIGFFTRKYDRFLIFMGLFIFISTALFANVFFIEQLGILIVALLPLKEWDKINNRFRRSKPAVL
ncbi:hypothetical protein DBR32_05385 [Taibaiella sp. KBW10]|uniref:hypothetical protein n=1 Tax=Taibaiella sp. KBW10 TaxID=2153357 RepID=UPI000F597350|nr:hypothetical protein [Taibaiella sp. KBW10]RQO31397.1 hypothetical protein DBR32_05385 [Taibaiella sp. KBW10]